MEPAPRASRFEGDGDGGGEFLRPVVVEQREEAGGVRTQRLSAFGEALEERGGGGDGDAEAVAGGVCVGLAGGGEEAFEVLGVLDGQSGVEAAAGGGRARSARRGCGRGWRRPRA